MGYEMPATAFSKNNIWIQWHSFKVTKVKLNLLTYKIATPGWEI